MRVAGPPRPAPRMWPFYAGGFLGPFGGSMTTPMLPELGAGLGASLTTVAWSMPAYLLPFAAIMLVSGTLAETWGRARTVRIAYLAYAAASLVCAVAPDATVFLAGRGLQGAANAFTSPLLVAALSEAVGRLRLSRTLGVFGGWQAAGQAFGPLAGGLAATVAWQWAFVGSAVAAVVLAFTPDGTVAAVDDEERDPADGGAPGATPDEASAKPVPAEPVSRWRALANRQLVLACAVAFGLYLSTGALLLLGALLAGDRFGLGPDARGLVVASFGVAGLLTAGWLSRVADRTGVRVFGVAVLAVFTVSVAVAGVVPSPALLVAAVCVAGVTSAAGRVVVNVLAVTSTPANRAGATSMALSWQFLGSAVAPVALLPLYAADPAASFVVAAVGGLVATALLVGSARRPAR